MIYIILIHKDEDNCKKVFDINTTQYLGRSGDGSHFLYDGNVIYALELGNIAYGYWGKSLGFFDETLYYGGGFARLKADGILNGNIFNKFVTDKYYGDRPEDIADIMKGTELYNKQNVLGCGGGGIR